jgi:CRISPR/Cas system-associated endonuclease Cas1
LNYLYALLESEARIAAAALGLDPGLGVLHVDMQARDSLACDLMEAARPQVDAYLLDWITRQPLKREWFFEQRDGNCRLMGPFAMSFLELFAQPFKQEKLSCNSSHAAAKERGKRTRVCGTEQSCLTAEEDL